MSVFLPVHRNARLLASAMALALLTLLGGARGDYPGWQHSGVMCILTTPDGANLPPTAAEEGFPLLVRLDKDFFDFRQAQPRGEDIRFSTSGGAPLPYQIEQWDAAQGSACIWVRVPRIKGNERQTLTLHWGKTDAASESSGAAVFNASNGYLSVWHMNDPVKDEVGTLPAKDVGTTATAGIIGQGRHLAGGQGIFGGNKIPNYPAGSAPHSSEAWFRADRPNTTILGWGNEGGGRGSKVRMQLRSPPHVHIDSDFCDVNAASRLPMAQWIHVVHTFGNGTGKIYINGQLDGTAATLLNIKSPSRLWLGGWYNNYDFIGDIDEVRISQVTRSADWVRLEYENQKPLQTLVGPLVQPGSAFSVTPPQLTVLEGQRATVTATAGGAQKIYWIVKRGGQETIAAVDRFTYTFDAGRVVGDTTATLQCQAVYPEGIKTADIPVLIKEDIPEPVFTLAAPTHWDGRQTIEVAAQVANLGAMQAKGAGDLDYTWSASDIAVITQTVPGKLILQRSQNSGKLTVTARVHNGGQASTQSATIEVREPQHDAWLTRTPARDEKPEDNELYARDDHNEGTLFYNGTLTEAADSVFLRVFADGQLYKTEKINPGPDKAYAFTVKLKPGLTKYKVEFGTSAGDHETVLNTVNNIVCGDAYLVDGQSNAVAMDWGKGDFPDTSEWVRSYGSMGGNPRSAAWGQAVRRSPGDHLAVGYWAFDLGKRLVESHKIPICIINGAVGGTRIDQHQRNPQNPTDMETIYGRLLWRVQQAKLTHGIRGVLWHQGENDQGADGPTGGFGWETYRQYFITMAAAWKQDYPNIQHYYVFQIWPKSCSMGSNGSDNVLRDVQRLLPTAFSNMSVMSTLGIKPPGGCHYPAAGYAEFARLMCPLVERDNYGATFAKSITPPDLKRAYYTSNQRDAIALEFDQPMTWDNRLASQFYLDGVAKCVTGGEASGNIITLKLNAGAAGQKITYLDSAAWSPDNLLYGSNGIAALTFCNVPILSCKPQP